MLGMPVRVEVGSNLFAWACERSRIEPQDLIRRFPKLPAWQAGEGKPTLKQLQDFAEATYTPLGMLLLPAPPTEEVPLPDFRTLGDGSVSQPSADLLDVVYACQDRQEWYRDFALENGDTSVGVVGSISLSEDVIDVAELMRRTLDFEVGNRGHNWSAAFRELSERAEDIGLLVMVSGIVGSNTRRILRPEEFRGFALADSMAPLIFINGADTKAAQIFTLAHEMVHIWLGQSALSDANLLARSEHAAERWCNEVAAEFLVPLSAIRASQDQGSITEQELERLAREFKVSTLVVLRRVHDTGRLSWNDYRTAFEAERERVLSIIEDRDEGHGGGNYYNTQPVRVSKRFAYALITSTLEGKTMYRDAFRMLGLRKLSTFTRLGHALGVI